MIILTFQHKTGEKGRRIAILKSGIVSIEETEFGSNIRTSDGMCFLVKETLAEILRKSD